MAIEINKSTTRVDPPVVTITGTEIEADGGLVGPRGFEYSVQDERIDGLSVRKTPVKAFVGDVTLIITVDPDFSDKTTNYSSRSAGEFVGEPSIKQSDAQANLTAETYYTVNGKDPKRTKANLYTGSVLIRRNLSGSDNTIIKARTYYLGKWSKVKKVEIRITRNNKREV